MRTKLTPISIALAVFAILLGTTGCASLAGPGFPDASVNPANVPLGSIQGSDFGGHAPLVGAHVYVLQPGTSGYGSQATSLLTGSNSGNGYATTQNTGDPNIPTGTNGWYYETTDASGAFNISGDYTCVAGQPVYLYLYGGSPTFPSANNVFSVNQVVVSGVTGLLGQIGTATYTMTTTTTQNFYVGEQVVGSNFNTLAFNVLNATLTVQSVGLTTTTFSVTTSGTLLELDGTYSTTGTITAEPAFNPAVVNLAVLGNCPNGGTDVGFANSIRYVYVNEVSTAAAAYVFAPFTLPTNNDATHIGTPATAQAELGIANAALTANQLYDIQGSSISTTYAGEGHIARQFTPGGNGIVPQATLDTVGNVLAQCVDSNNGATTIGTSGTYANGAYSGISPQCATLFLYATNTGVPTVAGTSPGTQPFDTAAAALNIARHPAGDPSYTAAFMSNLYTLPTGNPPFAPNLTSEPNDFGVAIYYPQSKTVGSTTVTNSNIQSPESVAVDASGAVWIDDHGGASVYKYSPLGVLDFTVAYSSSDTPGYLSIDPSGNAWVGNVTGLLTELTPSGTFASTGGTYATGYAPYDATGGYKTTLSNGYAVATDGNGNAYTVDANNNTGYRLTQYNAAGTATGGTYETNAIAAMASCFGTGTDTGGAGSPIRHVDHIAVDASANLWLSSEGFAVSGDGVVCKITSSGALATNFSTALKGISATTTSDESISIDASGNAWISTGYNVANAGLLEVSASGGSVTKYYSGATLNYPFGSAIDGNNTAWVVDRSNGTIANFNIANSAFESPASNYKFSGSTSSLTSGGLNVAADPSGNLWMTDYFNHNLVEVIGIAGPSVTPLSLAAKNGTFGTKP